MQAATSTRARSFQMTNSIITKIRCNQTKITEEEGEEGVTRPHWVMCPAYSHANLIAFHGFPYFLKMSNHPEKSNRHVQVSYVPGPGLLNMNRRSNFSCLSATLARFLCPKTKQVSTTAGTTISLFSFKKTPSAQAHQCWMRPISAESFSASPM